MLKLFTQVGILSCCFSLSAQRTNLLLYFRNNLVCSLKVQGSLLQTSFGIYSLGAEFGYSCRLLENSAALIGLGGHYLVNSALSDDGIALLAYARISK